MEYVRFVLYLLKSLLKLMAKLKIKIEQIEGDKEATITVICSKDMRDHILKILKDTFEIEMYRALIRSNSKETTITLVTTDQEKIKMIKTGLIRTYRHASGLGIINAN